MTFITTTAQKQHELCIGEEQVGKSHQTMDDSRERLLLYNHIQIHFAFGTNEIEENQFYHIDRVFQPEDRVKIIRGHSEMRDLVDLLKKGYIDQLNEGRLVISCIGNHHALMQVLTLVSLTDPQHPYKFDVYIDESDTYGIDHDRVVSGVQKDNLINSIADAIKVARVKEITATPMSQIVSQSNYTMIYKIDPKSGYKGITHEGGFTYNSVLCSKDIKDFENGKKLPQSIKCWIEDGLCVEGQLSLVSTDHRVTTQIKMAKTISRTVAKKAAVIVVNSHKDQHVYIDGINNKNLCKGKLRSILNACRDQGYKNVFVIGQKCLNRSITIEDDEKYYDACRILFNCAMSSADPEILQRVCRIAGYSLADNERIVTCTLPVHMRILKASENRKNLVNEIAKIKDATVRRATLLKFDKLMKTNIFGNKNNGYGLVTANSNKKISETKEPQFVKLNRLEQWTRDQLPLNVQEQLDSRTPSKRGTPFYKWVMDNLAVSYIVTAAKSPKGSDNMYNHIPNKKSTDNTPRRDALFDWDNETLTISILDKDVFKRSYSVQHPRDKMWWNFKVYNVPDGDVVVDDKYTIDYDLAI